MMIEISDGQFVKNTKSGREKISSIKEALDIALKYNSNSAAKIMIYKSFAVLNYLLISDGNIKDISVSFNSQLLDRPCILSLIQHGYCCNGSFLIFVNDNTRNSLDKLFFTNSFVEKISALCNLDEKIISNEERELLLEYWNTPRNVNSNIDLILNPYPYQKTGVKWLRKCFKVRKSCLLADDMGLGKTAQIIAFIVDELKNGLLQNILIIVPNSLLANWQNEISKFTNGVDVYLHWGKNRDGFSQILNNKSVILTTYSTLVSDEALFVKMSFDAIVLDEASLVKNPFSQRTKTINKLNYSFAIAMTGTPFENSLSDLWSISNILKNDFLGSWRNFQNEFLQDQLIDIPKAKIEAIEKRISKIMMRRLKEDVLSELPPKVDIFTPLTMMDEEKRLYLNLENDIKENLSNKEIAFKLISDLRKFTSHPLLHANSLSSAKFENIEKISGKFRHLLSLIKEASEQDKILVFANNIDIIEVYKNIFAEQLSISTFKIDGTIEITSRQEIIDDFSKVEGKAVLFLNPITAGMGLNITSANHVIHYSRQWNPALEAQATARAFRNGQKKTVFVHYLYYNDTIEQKVHDRLNTKSDISSSIIQPSITGNAEELFYEQLMEVSYEN